MKNNRDFFDNYRQQKLKFYHSIKEIALRYIAIIMVANKPASLKYYTKWNLRYQSITKDKNCRSNNTIGKQEVRTK